MGERHHMLELLPALWGIGGVLVLLLNASWRLGQVALAALSEPLGPAELVLLAGWLVVMAYAEGYRGFQRAFAPRAVVRALALNRRARPLSVWLAPLYCMGLIDATRRRLWTSWSVLAGISALVAAMRLVPQPYRGLVDAGVVMGLVWGASAIVASFIAALRGRLPAIAADLPAEPAAVEWMRGA